MTGYRGHMTLADGSRVPLTEDDAEALWHAVEAARISRAEAMPTAKDALAALVEAQARLRELGWAPGGGIRVRRGDDCAVAEIGSTGIWRGRVDADGTYVHYADCVRKPRDAWLKPLADLTEDERTRMEECDRRVAEYYHLGGRP